MVALPGDGSPVLLYLQCGQMAVGLLLRTS